MSKIVAVITTNKEKISGGLPVFVASTPEEQEKLAFNLENILDANAHDLKNGIMIIVDHKSGS